MERELQILYGLAFPGTVFPPQVRGLLSLMGMELNEKKTGVYGKNCLQQVTGIAVNQVLQLPKKERRALRMECHFCRRFGPEVHLQNTGRGELPMDLYLRQLGGKLEYLLSVNPEDEEFQRERLFIRELLTAWERGDAALENARLEKEPEKGREAKG